MAFLWWQALKQFFYKDTLFRWCAFCGRRTFLRDFSYPNGFSSWLVIFHPHVPPVCALARLTHRSLGASALILASTNGNLGNFRVPVNAALHQKCRLSSQPIFNSGLYTYFLVPSHPLRGQLSGPSQPAVSYFSYLCPLLFVL